MIGLPTRFPAFCPWQSGPTQTQETVHVIVASIVYLLPGWPAEDRVYV